MYEWVGNLHIQRGEAPWVPKKRMALSGAAGYGDTSCALSQGHRGQAEEGWS